MAVVTSTFSTAANAVWANATWSANDTSGKVNTELVNWVTAIGDTNKIEIIQNPGNATSRGVSAYVTWILRTREADTATDCGIAFHGRYAGTGTTSASGYVGSYNNRTTGTASNGYGTYTTLSFSNSNEGFTVAGTVLTAYEATGNTPWFLYSWENNTRTDRRFDLIMRADTTNIISGSYYPASGLSKWIYAFGSGNANSLVSAQNSYVFPFKGINTNGVVLRHPTPTYNGYFFRLGAQYGNNHYLGHLTNDILVSSNSTGQFGDTTVVDGVTYTCFGNHGVNANYWIKTSA